ASGGPMPRRIGAGFPMRLPHCPSAGRTLHSLTRMAAEYAPAFRLPFGGGPGGAVQNIRSESTARAPTRRRDSMLAATPSILALPPYAQSPLPWGIPAFDPGPGPGLNIFNDRICQSQALNPALVLRTSGPF